MMRVKLTRGLSALVDDSDFQLVSEYLWRTQVSGSRLTHYAVSSDKGRTVLLHRLILAAPQGLVVDHIDGDGLNNQRSNLRLCAQRENLRNQPKRRGCTTSQFKGAAPVYGSKTGKWAGKIIVDGRLQHLGTFNTEVEAARAYDRAARELHGEFARLNFPNG